MRAKVVTVMRWYAQDEVDQEDIEQNEVDGMKKSLSLTVSEIFNGECDAMVDVTLNDL